MNNESKRIERSSPYSKEVLLFEADSSACFAIIAF